MYRHLPLAIASALIMLLTTHFAASQETGNEIQVINVEHSQAHEIANVVNDTIGTKKGESGPRIAVDHRTNTLVVNGKHEDLELIRAIVQKLDTPPRRKTHANEDRYFKSYAFPNRQTLEQSSALLRSMLKGKSGVKLDFDPNTLSLFLETSDANHQFAKTLFQEVSQADKMQPVGNVHIATFLVVDGSQIDDKLRAVKQLQKPGERLQKVFLAAKEKGLVSFREPMIASRVTSLTSPDTLRSSKPNSNAQPSGRFQNESIGSAYSISNGGSLTQLNSNKFKLRSMVEVSISSDGSAPSTEFNSIIELPLDHPVLLSCSTIGEFDAVVVVLLSEE